jgi:hypothetical protein
MNLKELAEQAGLAYKTPNGKYWIDAGHPDIHLERFAELVAAAEREECAKLCDARADADSWEGWYADQCAIAIRGRTV